MTEFKKITFEDRDLIRSYYERYPSRSCERTFAYQYLWSQADDITFAEVEDTLVMKSVYRARTYFAWPAGPKERIAAAIEELDRYAREELSEELRFYHMTPTQFGQLEAIRPGEWTIDYNRDLADYIYDRDKLATLAGKKLHSKRNHINRFIEHYPDWRCEPLCDGNAADAEQIAIRWRDENDCSSDPDKAAESCFALNSIAMREKLQLTGAVLYAEEDPVAFTVGERLSDDTYVIHVEKAFADIQGAYAMINREFVRQACGDCIYVNREEDTGDEGLRKAKMSYRPAFMEEKGIAVRSQEKA